MNDYLYIDKTEYVYNITHGAPKYFFLSRPQRFGKYLLTSTLHSYFDGQKDLFKGLAIEKQEKEWTQYPVLHFDMSLGKHLDKDALERYLARRIAEHEETYGITKLTAKHDGYHFTWPSPDVFNPFSKPKCSKAMNQINLKDYPARFALQNLPVMRVGINFSTKERTITDWNIDE